jgi:hypothetical protein
LCGLQWPACHAGCWQAQGVLRFRMTCCFTIVAALISLSALLQQPVVAPLVALSPHMSTMFVDLLPLEMQCMSRCQLASNCARHAVGCCQVISIACQRRHITIQVLVCMVLWRFMMPRLPVYDGGMSYAFARHQPLA